MKIHQLSVNYLAEQDRILMRVNTAASEEMRLWLTRRLMLGLWPLLSKLLMPKGEYDKLMDHNNVYLGYRKNNVV